MGIPKEAGTSPEITGITPPAGIAGGELQIEGSGFAGTEWPRVSLGNVPAHLVVGSNSMLIARIPDNATIGKVTVASGENSSSPWTCDIGIQIADGLHPVASPAVDSNGIAFSTFSGARGQKTPLNHIGSARQSTLVAIMGRMSIYEKRIVKWSEVSRA